MNGFLEGAYLLIKKLEERNFCAFVEQYESGLFRIKLRLLDHMFEA